MGRADGTARTVRHPGAKDGLPADRSGDRATMKGLMKRITLGALALLLSLQGAFAATLTITLPWTQVLSRPEAGAPALGLAFGNDTLTVVERRPQWVAVRLAGGRLGWIAAAAAAPAGAVADAPATVQAPPADGPAAGVPPAAGATLAQAGADGP
jgi:hypothetical protein